MFRTLTLLLVGSLVTTLAGCASSKDPSASVAMRPANLDGTWSGSTVTGGRGLTLNLRQSGTNVTGTLAGGGPLNGPIKGTMEGNTIKLTERSGLGKAPWLRASGDVMTGELGGVVVNLQRARTEAPATTRR